MEVNFNSEPNNWANDGSLCAACLLSHFGSCGPHLPRNGTELIPLKSLENDVQDHFSSLGIKAIQQSYFNHDITTEKGLVCQRADLSEEVSNDELICPKHRYTYGIYYRLSRRC